MQGNLYLLILYILVFCLDICLYIKDSLLTFWWPLMDSSYYYLQEIIERVVLNFVNWYQITIDLI